MFRFSAHCRLPLFASLLRRPQDGTEWGETTLKGDEKIEDTIQCISTSGYPGHASIEVGSEFSTLEEETDSNIALLCSHPCLRKTKKLWHSSYQPPTTSVIRSCRHPPRGNINIPLNCSGRFVSIPSHQESYAACPHRTVFFVFFLTHAEPF